MRLTAILIILLAAGSASAYPQFQLSQSEREERWRSVYASTFVAPPRTEINRPPNSCRRGHNTGAVAGTRDAV